MDIIPFPVTDDDEREVDMAARAVCDSLTIATPGHVFTQAFLAAAFGMEAEPQDAQYYKRWLAQYARLVDAWSERMLRDHHVHIEHRPGRGYVVIAPQETPFVAVKVASRELRKAIRKASDKIQYAPDGLTDRQRQDRMDALAYLGKVDLAITHARPKPPRPGARLRQQHAG